MVECATYRIDYSTPMGPMGKRVPENQDDRAEDRWTEMGLCFFTFP